MKLERIKYSSSIEKRILTASIVSTEFLARINPVFHSEYIENQFIRKVMSWVIDYHKEYDKAPSSHIKDIYTVHQKTLGDEESEIIETLLNEILVGYSEGQFNDDYVANQAINFFKSRELTITTGNVKFYLDKGEVDNAEKELENYRKVVALNLSINGFIYEEESINDVFKNEEDNCLLKFPKSLGKFMGGFEREWLVGISAPYKRGKTQMLSEFAKIAALSGLRVVSFNLEMSLNNMRKRTYMSLTGSSDIDGLTIFPCFDCQNNQNNSCQKEERTNRIKIPAVFDKRSKYKTCTHCKDYDKNDFEMAMWNEIIDVPKCSYSLVKERLDALKKLGKAHLWIETLPRFSASVGDIERKLDNLEYLYNFIPDVILIDYADILKSDDSGLKGVEKEDEVWMTLGRMASIRKCLVVTATQLNKESLDAKQISASHSAKWIGKLGHVDVMLALNQTPAEKEMSIMRVSCIEHRHKDFIPTDNCYVLTKYSSGTFHLDSYWKERNQI